MAQAARLNLRMQKELNLLLTDPPPGVSLVPSDNEGSSISCLSVMEARIAGPEGTAYAGGVFTIRIQIPERYPFQPPNVTFATPIYHPNIDNGGRICLDILNLPPKGAWQPSLNISTVLTSIGLLLSEPNPDDGLMCDTSREYKYNRQVFDQKAQSWTEKYAKADFCRSEIDACITAMSENTTMSKLSEKAAEDPIPETDACRKKIRIVGAKLSLRPVAEKSYSVNKENIMQTECLSIPHSQNATGASSTAPDQVADGCGHLMQTHASQNSNEEPVKWAQVPETVEAAIVLDSEESDDEIERPRRVRLSLLRRRIVVEGRSSRQR